MNKCHFMDFSMLLMVVEVVNRPKARCRSHTFKFNREFFHGVGKVPTISNLALIFVGVLSFKCTNLITERYSNFFIFTKKHRYVTRHKRLSHKNQAFKMVEFSVCTAVVLEWRIPVSPSSR